MDAATDFGVLLGQAYAAFVAELHRGLAKEGFDDLGTRFGYVFRVLAERDLNLRELAELLGMTSPGALKIVDEMVEKAYVERVPDPADGRVKRLRLAPRGRKALQRAQAFHKRFEEQLAAELGERRVANVRAVLTELVSRASTGDNSPVLRPM